MTNNKHPDSANPPEPPTNSNEVPFDPATSPVTGHTATIMTDSERRGAVVADGLFGRELYTVEGLQRALYSFGAEVLLDDLYAALKASGWIKLRLIRDRLLETKRKMPKQSPYDGLRHVVKWPLLVKRDADLPEFEQRGIDILED